MEINLSKYAGFCDGVKRAYDMVNSLDLEKAKKPIDILGSLVHNPEVNQKIEERGIQRIDRKYLFNAKPGEIGTLVITAHGSGPDIYEICRLKGIEIFDTTCPKVIKVQRLARVYANRGYRIVLVGDRNHKEIMGINEWGDNNAVIISEESDLEGVHFGNGEKVVVLSQTTQNEDFFAKIGEKIKEKYSTAEIISTTCSTTHERQAEVKQLAKQNDLMIIIGSETSANSKRLWEISKTINPRSYFIEKSSDINPNWLKDVEKVGVSAGASTPDWTIEDVTGYLKKP
jgi:(E)-4-hydroxy-3-methyl-but-2-enyl pyrophosphate reductase